MAEGKAMINGTNPIDSLFSNNGSLSSATGLFGMSPTDFSNLFDQAMAQAKTPADQAQLDMLQTQYSDLNTLSDMFSDSSGSVLGPDMGGLFSTGGAFGLPSWTTSAESLLGNDPNVQSLMALSQQASLLAQTGFSSGSDGLAGLGTGGSFDSLF